MRSTSTSPPKTSEIDNAVPQGGAARQTLTNLNISNNAHTRQYQGDPGILPETAGLEGKFVESSMFGAQSETQGQLWV